MSHLERHVSTVEIAELYRRYVLPTYAPPAIALVRGRGTTVWDADGRRYLDFIGGIAVAAVGHCHPKLVRAIRRQVGRLIHCSNLFYNEPQALLAQALAERSLRGGCFFANSGAEANEALIKLARRWGSQNGGRWRIVTMRNSFHGRTLATLTATGQAKVQQGYEPLPEGFDYAEFNNLESVQAALTDRTAAVLVEAVQGEGGIVPARADFLQGLRRLCTEAGILLLMDEIQCGMGRTGAWWAWQQYGIEPDAFSIAKGLGGGYPIGAIVVAPGLTQVFQPGSHASTFGGSPLACAAALAVIDIIEEEHLLANARDRGADLIEGLRSLQKEFPFLVDVRGVGLMVGLVLDRPAKPIEVRLREAGLLVLATAERVLRFLPPLTVTRREIDRALNILRKVFRTV
jgi:predicted acetylornithine/succinylornithine family transaminase